VTGLWLGIKPGMVLTINPAITYGVYERVKTLLLLANSKAGSIGKLTPGITFLLGALSKTLATVVTYPYIMAKVRIQARSSDAETTNEEDILSSTARRTKSPSALSLLLRVMRNEGISGWYQGMSAQIIKAVLSQALLFVSKEQFEHWAIRIMLLFSGLTSKS